MLQLQQVKKHYYSYAVVDIPFLQLTPGIYWVKGENGSGKTTLLKMISGLLPFEGDILFNNTSVKNQPVAYRQSVSWSEAEPLYPSFITGTDLLSLYRSIRRAPRAEAEYWTTVFHMSSWIHQPTGTYSAGMMKKLSLALAFLGNATLIVLDEPLITLDADTMCIVSRCITERQQQSGATFLMSSHQRPDDRLLLASNTLTLHNSHITHHESFL